jgi:nucleoside-diphosphate-sugar epimerase
MQDGTILVTGAAGLIGNAVRVMLEADGRAVTPIDLSASTEEGRPITVASVSDMHRLHAVAAAAPLNGIIHCAAHSGPMVARDNPFDIVNVNVLGTANILEVARIHRVRRVVFCSTVSAYGNTGTSEGLIGEDSPLRPSSVYGGSKAAAEHIVNTYASQHGVDGVSIRIGWVYGPRRRTSCALREMINNSLLKRSTHLPYGRDFYKQYIFIDDAARALIRALDAPALTRRSYNATGGTYHTLGELAEIVTQILPDARITVDPRPDPDDDVQGRFDIRAAAADLDWRPEVPLEDGLRRYAAWLRQRLPA